MSATHVLWYDDGAWSFVIMPSPDIDPDNPNLAPLPEGIDTDWVAVDPQARTIAFDAKRLDAKLHRDIDAGAEAARLTLITPGDGQAMEYDEAAAQAAAYLADPVTPETGMLQSDVDAGTIDPRTGSPVTTIAEAAGLILFMRAQWRVKGAAIRTARLSAKRAVVQAGTPAEKFAAAAVDWAALLPE